MEHSLKPSKTYSLTREEGPNRNKEFYFVKLTDSSIRAVEEYLQHKAAVKGHPRIQFLGQNGVIRIPSKPGSASQDVGKRFKFSCSYFARDGRQGITECMYQASKKQTMLAAMGMIEKRIAVLATDEAYEMTKNKMAQADQERKEIRTKEIKINHSKSKKKKPLVGMIGKELKKTSKGNPLSNSSITKSVNGLKPGNSHISSNTKGHSYKDRVIHILALRPHKKPEIVARLQREGINQKDKISLGTILQQVATMQDNSFKLNKHHYADLKPDTWPYYSEHERANVKRYKSQILIQESSPKVSSTSRSPEEKGTKRPLNDDYSHTTSKKQRIAKPIQDPSTSSSGNQPIRTKSETSINKLNTSREKLSNGADTSQQDLKREKNFPASATMKSSAKSNEVEQVQKKENASSPTVASTSDIPEYILKYKPVKSYEQRCKYKQEFQAQYREYIDLKEIVDNVSRKFLELDRVRRKYPEDSEDAQKIKQEIYRQYEQHQKDTKYQEMKQRYADLYARLSHIKKLVVEYDQNHLKSVA